MLIEDAKVKELVYSGNTVIFLLPNRECMRENSFFWSPSQLITFCSTFCLPLQVAIDKRISGYWFRIPS